MRIVIGLAMALATVAPAAATTTVLDFSGDICGASGGFSCGNGSLIATDYGSTTNVTAAWSSRNAIGNGAVVQNNVVWWSTGYADLVGVAYSISQAGEVRLTVAPGFKLTLDSVKVGGWPNFSRDSGVRVYDLSYNLLLNTGLISFPGGTAQTVFLGQNSTAGLIFQWGPDSFNGGIDDLTYTVDRIGDGVIPEPATWALMIAGFGVVGMAARRRRVAAA